MFIGKYELDGVMHNYIYFKTPEGFKEWNKDTFSPTCEGIELLDMSIKGKTYEEKKRECKKSCYQLAIEFCMSFMELW